MINKTIGDVYMEIIGVKKKRLNVDLPEYMLDELDIAAKLVGLNRTAIIAVIIKQYLDQQKSLAMLGQDGILKQIMEEINKRGDE